MRISDWSSDVCSSDLGDLSPKAKSLLSVVEHLAQRDEHRSKLDPETARWTASLKSNANPYLKHPQVAAFNSLDTVAPTPAGPAVDPVFASLNPWLPHASDPWPLPPPVSTSAASREGNKLVRQG